MGGLRASKEYMVIIVVKTITAKILTAQNNSNSQATKEQKLKWK